MAVTNTFAAIPGVVGIRAAAYLRESWGWYGVFWSCGILYILATAIYILWGSAKRMV